MRLHLTHSVLPLSVRMRRTYLLTISPELLGQLAATEAPLTRALNADTAKALDLPAVNFDEAGFRFALNQDAMATEKLAEGIRGFVTDAIKLEQLMLAL